MVEVALTIRVVNRHPVTLKRGGTRGGSEDGTKVDES